MLAEARGALIVNSIAASSLSTYASSFKHWRLWRVARSLPLFLVGDDFRSDQAELVSFVAYMGVTWNYGHGTVHVMIFAVRFHHLAAGHGDPLQNTPLLKLSLKGLKRMQGGPRRKISASMDLIRDIIRRLDLEDWDDLMLALALVVMFLFLLRSREALRKGAFPDPEQCLRVRSVSVATDGEIVTGADVEGADEMIVMFGKHKGDQSGQGSVHNVFASADEICPLKLYKRAARMNPAHFAKPDRFFFTLKSGKVLHRDKVEGGLRAVAVERGLPPKALAPISLRSGGASAMWNEGFSTDEIKRRGRWLSDCWRLYVWEGRERARNVGARMLSSSFSQLASLARFARDEA